MEDNHKTCSLCKNRAVYLDRVTGTHRCGIHLKQSVEERVLARIRESGDLPAMIGVAYSGGKDSSALLAVLANLRDQIPARLVALTIDEGIGGYRVETIQHAETVCRELGILHRIITFQEVFGHSLDQLMVSTNRKACTVCGILRRRALEILAKQMDIRLILTGHNQDDHAQTALMNALSADIKKVFAGTGNPSRFARRVKPFFEVSEREVTVYAILAGTFRDLPECPYAGGSLRGEVRGLLNRFEAAHPGSMRNAAQCEEDIRARLRGKTESIPLRDCRICGWPGSGEICQVCALLGPTWIENDRIRE